MLQNVSSVYVFWPRFKLQAGTSGLKNEYFVWVLYHMILCVCVCVGGVFEEMTRVLKILLRESQTQEWNAGAIENFDDGASHTTRR